MQKSKSGAKVQQKTHICKHMREKLQKMRFFVRRLASMTLIILGELERPEIALHGLFAARLVFLSLEGSLVGCHLGQIFCTCGYSCCHCAETCALFHLLGTRSGATSYGVKSAEVQTCTVRVGGSCYAVGAENHLLVACVLRFLVDAGERTADGFDSVSPLYFCHGMFGVFAEQTAYDRLRLTAALLEVGPLRC